MTIVSTLLILSLCDFTEHVYGLHEEEDPPQIVYCSNDAFFQTARLFIPLSQNADVYVSSLTVGQVDVLVYPIYQMSHLCGNTR